ncbi:PilW family protein [Paracidovorax anthurii]|uniref:Type IV pilus assembly protein PilW n=1 Tax=Paracidovorax anthurii TaxID=78229 RepID=A0A328Z1P5_9BURK|nr:PilW family protein [Paracidovorax anthurii]RAR76166.1 type IV pilus assembly protein PilW [Paracidovorax anthurii]
MSKPTCSHLSRHSQQGLTLVELLVAMAVSLLVVMAAVAAMSTARAGFRSVDAASQLRDNGRLAESIMRRIILQGGFINARYAVNVGSDFPLPAQNTEPNIKGFNNAGFDAGLATGSATSAGGGNAGLNGSDLLIVRYQSGEVTPGGAGDRTMIGCDGTVETPPVNAADRMVSVFYVDTPAGTGQPSLMCARRCVSAPSGFCSTPLVEGVENLQVLYGVDGVTPGGVVTEATDTIPKQYLRADQLTSASNTATLANWRRVRSIRVGMVLRGPAGSAPETAVPAQYPLGTRGVMDTVADPGSAFASQRDARLRQSVTFTVHLRNPQDNL